MLSFCLLQANNITTTFRDSISNSIPFFFSIQATNIPTENFVVWTSLGLLPRWVPGPTTRWAPGTTRLGLHDTVGVEHKDLGGEVLR
jgi:hypothetical protein